LLYIVFLINTIGQENKILIFDTNHGQNADFAKIFNELLPNKSDASIITNGDNITVQTLKDKTALILFLPTKSFSDTEINAIKEYINSGGSLLLIFDQEFRMSLDGVGVNKIIVPFGIELTEDTPAPHNCGAIAEEGIICSGKRELPYSGGRSVKGGIIISKVNAAGNYIHSAFVKTPNGGKIIVMSDGMAGLLMGEEEGERLTGTNPSDTKYWGKDSRIFMEEILNFLMK
ncbi:hypothetical protein ACFLTE_06710, partial [Bacteroidota bacterium]